MEPFETFPPDDEAIRLVLDLTEPPAVDPSGYVVDWQIDPMPGATLDDAVVPVPAASF